MRLRKWKRKYSTIALIALVILVVGATYEYFQNQYGSASNADVKVTTYTTDVLTFETEDVINITADQETFAQGKGNRTSSTFARATLQANNKTNTATANYYVYLNIRCNDFEYSKDSSLPELLLSITDNSGNQVTKLTGLNYITVTDGSNKSVSGFDITKSSGLLTLVDNKEISASPKQIEEWNVTITLVNYNYDQNANTGKNFSGKLIIQKEKMITSLADCVISQYTGTQGENNIYYHDSNLTNGAGDNSYRYAGASADVINYICLGSSEATCPDGNRYVIDFWKENDWASASLNTTLNSTFKTQKLSGFDDKIAEVTWRVSGYNASDDTAKTVYTAEITNATKTHAAKIGLMYPSDYGYATIPDYWTTNLFDYNSAAKNKDWLFWGSYEWLLSLYSIFPNLAWYVDNSGNVNINIGVLDTSAVRPSFYLLSSVKYVSAIKNKYFKMNS